MKTKILGLEINNAGAWHEYFQKKYKDSTMEAYWKHMHTKYKEEYATVIKKLEPYNFRSELEKL